MILSSLSATEPVEERLACSDGAAVAARRLGLLREVSMLMGGLVNSASSMSTTSSATSSCIDLSIELSGSVGKVPSPDEYTEMARVIAATPGMASRLDTSCLSPLRATSVFNVEMVKLRLAMIAVTRTPKGSLREPLLPKASACMVVKKTALSSNKACVAASKVRIKWALSDSWPS